MCTVCLYRYKVLLEINLYDNVNWLYTYYITDNNYNR